MKLQRYALLSSIAASLLLAACGGGDGEGDSGTGSSGDSGTGQKAWKEFTTISHRCPMTNNDRLDATTINCQRGVFRGHLRQDGRACEVDFIGAEDGFHLTVAGTSYTFVPTEGFAPKLANYVNYEKNNTKLHRVEKQKMAATLDFGTVAYMYFDLQNNLLDMSYYDENGFERSGSGEHGNYSWITFNNFPREMQNFLGVNHAFICDIESVLFK